MARRDLRLTSVGQDALLDDLAALPRAPVGPHLEEEQILMLAVDSLSEPEREAVLTHLASCPDCLNIAEPYVEAAQPWLGEMGQERAASLRKRQTAASQRRSRLSQLADDLRRFLAGLSLVPPRTVIATRGKKGAGKTALGGGDGGPFAAVIERRPDGTLAVRVTISSAEPSLAGFMVVVSIGTREWRAPLRQVRERGKLEAEVRLPVEEDRDSLSNAQVQLVDPEA